MSAEPRDDEEPSVPWLTGWWVFLVSVGLFYLLCVHWCGCVLDWSGPVEDDATDATDATDAESVDDGVVEDAMQTEDRPDDAVDDQVDDAGPESPDEDDGWSDPSGEDGGEDSDGGLCLDTCNSAWEPSRFGRCDDGGPGSGSSQCDYGTDCPDCGPR